MHLGRLTDILLQPSAWLEKQVPFSSTAATAHSGDFLWDSITATGHFIWYSCYGDFKCARLQVPMDWQGTSSEANKTVDLAVVKLEATVPVTDPTYGGAVVMNPGGPGGSGVGLVLRGGHHIRTIVSAGPDTDNDTARNFDVIGFDPRGINNTRPLLTCFPSRLEAAAYALEEEAYGFIGTSDTSFDNLWASKRAVAEGCSKRAAEEGIAKHMSTAPVARDIIEIFERHGEWREAEAKHLLSLPTSSSEPQQIIQERTAWRKGAEMVQYWGFSYGSVLGATLSTMYPDRIHRCLLDGVADSNDYMAGGWTTNLQDTDIIFAKLAEHCWEGGVSNCAIYHEDGPAVIAENIQAIISGFKSEPIAVPADGERGPAMVTYNDLRRLIRDIVYWPLRDFPFTAEVLFELSKRNGTSLAIWAHSQRPGGLGEALDPNCAEDGPYSPSCFSTKQAEEGAVGDATYGIACSDAPGDRLTQSKEEFREYADKLSAQSSLIGASWAAIQLPCTAWHARPHWRYSGNFSNTTANPILFAGNTVDPVTPLRNAFKMASGFPGSGVLHQDSEGHCTASGISLCSGRAIRTYFQTGELPGEEGGLKDVDEWSGWDGVGKVCGVDRLPFDGYSADGPVPEIPKGAEEGEKGLWEALVGLNRNFP